MKNWTIGKKLAMGFATVLTITLLLGVVTWIKLGSVSKNVRAMTDESLPGLALSGEIRYKAVVYRATNFKHVIFKDPAVKETLNREAKALGDEITELVGKYEKEISTSEERDIYSKLPGLLTEYHAQAVKLREASAQGKEDEVYAILGSIGKVGNEMVKIVEALREYNAKEATKSSNQIKSLIASSLWTVALTIVAAMIAGAVLATLLTRGISRTLLRVAETLTSGADQTAAASSQVSSASQSLAQGASEQAASLEETSSSLEEMSSMTKRNSENSQKARELAAEACRAGDAGAQDMRNMVAAMDSIKASGTETSKIIKTIDEIAFQTNILALNAAVEAARAGEAGAGFAVVADEVRNLAQRSATAAKETSEKIAQALERSERGVQISQKVAKSLEEIIAKTRQVDELSSEVATACKEQSQGIEQINTAVTQMDKVTQSSAANAEETASAAEELSAQAVEMKHVVDELQKMVDGKGAISGNGARKLQGVGATPAQKPAPADAVATVNRLAAGKSTLAQSTARAAVKGKHGGNGNGKQLEEAIPMDKDFKDF
jgi:methyl-accepting chemotaxis protein